MYNLHNISSRMTSGSVLGLFLLLKIVAGGFDSASFYKTCETPGILCFGMKSGDEHYDKCVSEKSCDLQVAITKNKEHEGKVKFQLLGKPVKEVPHADENAQAQGVYVAVGLSEDKYMGDDSVVECVHDAEPKGKGNVYTSWNVGGAKKNSRLGDKAYITEDWVSYEDGKLFCEFYRDANTTVNEHHFDLFSDYSKYHILLAMGKTKDGDHPDYHEHANRLGSEKPILYKDAIKNSGTSLPSIQTSIKILSVALSLLGSALY